MNATPANGHRFLIALLLIATTLVALILAPFAGSLFAAAVLAVVMHPMHRWATATVGGRPWFAAGVLTVTVVLAVLVPLTWLTVVVVEQVVERTEAVATIAKQEGREGLLRELPGGLKPLAERVIAMVPKSMLASPPDAAHAPTARAPSAEASGDQLGTLLGGAAGIARTVLAGLSSLLIQTGVLIVALYCLLAQGKTLVQWLVLRAPLPKRQTEQFLDEFYDVTMAVFTSTVATAALQAAIATIGYWIAGIPYLAVALLLTFVAAFIPAVGGATIVVVVSLLLLATGATGWGIFLLVWGLIPVGLCDNIVKPLLARRGLRLPGAVVFFAMLGGLAMFGLMGVFAGPLIVSFFLVVVRALESPRGEVLMPGAE